MKIDSGDYEKLDLIAEWDLLIKENLNWELFNVVRSVLDNSINQKNRQILNYCYNFSISDDKIMVAVFNEIKQGENMGVTF